MNDRIPTLLVVAIIGAGLILGAAVYFFRMTADVAPPGGDLSLIRPVGAMDRTLGDPNAPVVIVTYSSIGCRYCKDFQEVMGQIMADYGPKGDVLWVYRHFPILEVSTEAALHAEAAECAGAQGGNAAFFRFVDALEQEEVRPGGKSQNPYRDIALTLGLDPDTLLTCTAGSEFEAKVAADFDNAIDAGAVGSPYTVILPEGVAAVPISGAIPFSAMNEVVERAIKDAATHTSTP